MNVMKQRRNALTVLISAFCILLLGCIMPFVCRNVFTSYNGEMGIIGGADTPTYTLMLTKLFGGLPIVLIFLGVSLLLSSCFCLLFPQTVKNYCNKNSTAISLALSAVSALALFCVFIWFAIVTFNEMSKHPIEYPVSIFLGVLSFVAFVGLIFLYFKERKTNWSVKGIIIDVLTYAVYLPTFFFAVSWLYEIVT